MEEKKLVTEMHDTEDTKQDWQALYETEHTKCADLAGRVADLEAANEELQWKLNRIKNNPLWKCS